MENNKHTPLKSLLDQCKDEVARKYSIAGRKNENWTEFWHDCLSYKTFQSLHLAMNEVSELYASKKVESERADLIKLLRDICVPSDNPYAKILATRKALSLISKHDKIK